MTLDQLKIFTAVVEQGGLGAASKVLNRTQPTLSVALKNLEEELGVSLFDRSQYRMTLTREGEELLTQAGKVLGEAGSLLSRASELSSGRESVLTLGLDYFCPLPKLLGLLKEFKQNCQGTRLDLKFGILHEMETLLEEETASLALTPFVNSPGHFEMIELCEIEIVPVMAASKNKTITEKQFLAQPQVIVRSQFKDQQGPFSDGVAGEQIFVSDHMIKKEMILSGLGWGHLEADSVREPIKCGALKIIKNKYVRSKKLPLFLVRKASSAKGMVSSELWEFLKGEFKVKTVKK